MAPGRRALSRRRDAALIALSALGALLALACESDPAPRAEPLRAKPQPAAAVAPAPLAAAPGVCGDDEQAKGHCGCGSTCTGKCGDSCSQAAPPTPGCGDPAAPAKAAPAAGGCGCGSHGNAAAVPVDAPLVDNGQAKVGDRTLCPVMSSPFVVKPDSPKTDYQGKTYYFCCDGCVDQFKKKPESFI